MHVQNQKIQESLEKVREVEKMIDVMGRNISKDIYSAVRRATSHLTKTEGNPAAASSNGTGIMSEDFKVAMISKADKSEVEGLQQTKANKCDIELSFKWLELVHKQLKQTIVLIIELLKF